jgi:hypothetical protein
LSIKSESELQPVPKHHDITRTVQGDVEVKVYALDRRLDGTHVIIQFSSITGIYYLCAESTVTRLIKQILVITLRTHTTQRQQPHNNNNNNSIFNSSARQRPMLI